MNELENQPTVPSTEPVPVIPETKTSMKKKIGIFAGVFVVLLVLAGLVVYQTYASPSKVWERFVKKTFDTAPTSAKERILISYQDKSQLDNDVLEKNPELQIFSNIKLSLDTNAYLKVYNDSKNNIDIDGDVKYTFESGSMSIGASVKLKAKDNQIYIDLGGIPFFSAILREINGGNKVDWVKFDLEEVKKMSEEAEGSSSNLPSEEEQLKKIQEILAKYQVVSVDKFLGVEKINDVRTMHFQNKVDKEELKKLLNEVFEFSMTLQPDSENISEEDKKNALRLLDVFFGTMIDKAEIKTFETWVGIFDSQLYRLEFVSNAPSLASMFEVASKAASMEEETNFSEDGAKEDPIKILEKLIKDISFDAEITLTEEVSDYGKEQEVQVPANSLDIIELIKQQTSQEMQMMEYEAMPSNNFQ